jgi:predicted GNAT superfamily acetyltransferase
MLAVLPEYQQRGVGLRLKWAQREESLSRGLALITWTFDPMQARNANLNLRRLGATATEFLENFYGVTTASLHHGLPTDRLLVRWDLAAPRVADAWQTKVRQALQSYMARGYVAADFAPTQEGGRRRPLYVLRRA